MSIYFIDAGGWAAANGTSASAPFVAGLIARAGHAGTTTAATLYASARRTGSPVWSAKTICPADARVGSVRSTAIRLEEVVPVFSGSMWVLPLSFVVGR
ncbi:hypothetical protein AB0F91_34200 [Amycolatopsis sp. NPDC023774]|uniref:hypothetical protein n=1 Tax=Amycolatopsis sp. NPDC023774 TaxID=3155015 RepID=UPI003402987E